MIVELTKIEGFAEIVTIDDGVVSILVAKCLAAAAQGSIDAYYDLGVAYSTAKDAGRTSGSTSPLRRATRKPPGAGPTFPTK